ncbi:hypothetical protein LCGC14_2252220, partial [marine sediment metagenome]
GYGIGCVDRGRFFQFDRHGDRARLSCLEAATGKLVWKFEYPTDYLDRYDYNAGPRSSPVVDGERVYIFGVEGMLHCLTVSDGKPLWKVDTAKRFGVVQNFFGVGSSPVVERDLLIVMVGGSTTESRDIGQYDLRRVVGNGTGVVAFDKHTGEVKYAITDELASYATPQLATIGGRRWCFVFARGGLIGFDPSSGKVDFHYPWRARLLESANASTPVVVDDEGFISEAYGPGSSLLKVHPGGYKVLWSDGPVRHKAMQTHWNTPIYHRGYLYGCSGRHMAEAELRCIQWSTGKVMWSRPGLRRTSLLCVDGHFVCLSEDGTLRLIEATEKAYVEVARVTLRQPAADRVADRGADPTVPFLERRRLLQYPAWAAPILCDGLLYVRGRDRLVCLRLIRQQLLRRR